MDFADLIITLAIAAVGMAGLVAWAHVGRERGRG